MGQTTNPQRLTERFVEAIQAITPSYEHVRLDQGDRTPLLQDARWSYIDAAREGESAEGIAGRAVRTFTLIWGFAAPNKLFYGGGEAYGVKLKVAASYNGIPAQDLESLISADGVDLRATLLDLLDPTEPGLYEAEYQGIAAADLDDQGNAYAEHLFNITYHQQTDW